MNEAAVSSTANSALITFAIYLLGVFFLAWLSSRVRRRREFMGEYFLGSRNLGLWAFALTFAAVTLRLELVVLTIAGLTYVEAIEILAWASWVPNLLVAEWLLRRPRRLLIRLATLGLTELCAPQTRASRR